MIDIQNLSKSEVLELERQIEEYKKTEKFLTGYKVTFCVKFNPNYHQTDCLGDTESFGDWLCNVLPEEIMKSFNLKKPEDVSGFDVVEMDEEDNKYWKDWWEWELGYEEG